MLKNISPSFPQWCLLSPVVGVLVLVLVSVTGVALPWWGALMVGATLLAAVTSAVHHAEVVALRLGEPFGTLVLAVAVTVIEVALVVSLMFAGGASAAALARDTVFAAIMIVCNGVVGLCLLVGGLRHKILVFRPEGTSAALAVLAALSTLTLVLPVFTTTSAGPTFSTAQLSFAGVVSLVLYGVFVFVQAVRHRDYFLQIDGSGDAVDEGDHTESPSTLMACLSMALLMVCLVVVVGLAKALAPVIERGVVASGAPLSVVGVLVALLVLLPETWAAVRAAARNRLQTSLNLALGSGLASIGLTIPAVAVVSLFFPFPLILGLTPVSMVLLFLTLIVATLTLSRGRATVLQGAVHLVLFLVFMFLAVVP